MCDCNCKCESREEKLKKIIEKYKVDKSNLIKVLNETQEMYGYIPKEAQIMISEKMKISLAEIYGVITFYSRFTLEPKGEYNISVCLGTACYVKGAENILNRFKEKLGISEGDCTKDGKFSLEVTRCIGACSSAPVFTVNDKVYGKATIEMVDSIIDEYSK